METLIGLVQATAVTLLVLLFGWLALVLPVLGLRRRRRLAEAMRGGGGGARLGVYRRTAVGQGLVAAAAVALALLAGARWVELGLSADVVTGAASLLVLVAGFVLVGLSRSRGGRSAGRAGLAEAAPLLPRSARERLAFAGVALVVGAAEEVVYRGVGLWGVQAASDARPVVAVLVVAGAFGLAHTWQGWSAVVQTAALGAVLGGIALLGGVLLAAAVHAAIDLRVLGVRPAPAASELRET